MGGRRSPPHRDARHATFKTKSDELDKSITAGELEESLVNLIEAKMLADDVKLFLAEKRSADLVAKIEALAAKAETSTTGSRPAPCTACSMSCSTRPALHLAPEQAVAAARAGPGPLQPKMLLALYKEQAKRTHLPDKNKKKKAAPVDEEGEEPEIEMTPWQDRLKDITPRIVQEELFYSAKKHIEHHGYADLMQGAIEGLDTTVSTRRPVGDTAAVGQRQDAGGLPQGTGIPAPGRGRQR